MARTRLTVHSLPGRISKSIETKLSKIRLMTFTNTKPIRKIHATVLPALRFLKTMLPNMNTAETISRSRTMSKYSSPKPKTGRMMTSLKPPKHSPHYGVQRFAYPPPDTPHIPCHANGLQTFHPGQTRPPATLSSG